MNVPIADREEGPLFTATRRPYPHHMPELSTAEAARSRAPVIGLLLAGLCLLYGLLATLAVASETGAHGRNWLPGVAYVAVNGLLLAALLYPLRPLRALALRPERAVRVGVRWMVIGLPVPIWLFSGLLLLVASFPAGLCLFLGGLIGRRLDRQVLAERRTTSSPCAVCADPSEYYRLNRVADDQERHAALFRCPTCDSLYEVFPEIKQPPEQLTVPLARLRFPGSV